jgi:cytochrome c oxidase subunit III
MAWDFTTKSGGICQFDDVEQQQEVASLGMWVFLVTEIMFFGGLFTGYAVYRAASPAAFAERSHHLDILLGGSTRRC